MEGGHVSEPRLSPTFRVHIFRPDGTDGYLKEDGSGYWAGTRTLPSSDWCGSQADAESFASVRNSTWGGSGFRYVVEPYEPTKAPPAETVATAVGIDRIVAEELAANLESIHLAWELARAHGGMSGAEALAKFERLLAGLLASAKQRGVIEGLDRASALYMGEDAP